MHSLKVMLWVVCVLVVVPLAMAGSDLGIRDTGRVEFSTPTRVAGTLLPAGQYVVRHTMEGQEHVMVFQSVNHKVPDVKAKCQLVQLSQKGESNQRCISRERRRAGAAGTRICRGYSQARLLKSGTPSRIVAPDTPVRPHPEAYGMVSLSPKNPRGSKLRLA